MLHRHVEAQFLVLSPEPASFDPRSVGRDPHRFPCFGREIVRSGTCGTDAFGSPAPRRPRVHHTPAGTNDERSIINGLQTHTCQKLIAAAGRFNVHLSVEFAATLDMRSHQPASGRFRRMSTRTPGGPLASV